jgi:hypothetical protein
VALAELQTRNLLVREVRGSVHHSTIRKEKSNKIKHCIQILLFHIYFKLKWIIGERRKRGRPRKTWMEGVRTAMKTRHLEVDQWLNRKEWCLGSERRRQVSQDRKDRYMKLNTFWATHRPSSGA